MPYYEAEGDNEEEYTFICEVCEQVVQKPTSSTPQGWVVIPGATTKSIECYCPDHAQEGTERKAAR
jgi:hypothetical protein